MTDLIFDLLLSRHFLCDYLVISFIVTFQVCAALVVVFISPLFIVSTETGSIFEINKGASTKRTVSTNRMSKKRVSTKHVLTKPVSTKRLKSIRTDAVEVTATTT